MSVDGAPVRSAIGRPVAVDAALSSLRLGPRDVLVMSGLGAVTDPGAASEQG